MILNHIKGHPLINNQVTHSEYERPEIKKYLKRI